MTLDEYAQQQTGLVLKIPAGTVLGREWYYHRDDGSWQTGSDAWREARYDATRREWRAITTDRDQYVELAVDAGLLKDQVLKALKNRAGKSRDGALTLKRRR